MSYSSKMEEERTQRLTAKFWERICKIIVLTILAAFIILNNGYNKYNILSTSLISLVPSILLYIYCSFYLHDEIPPTISELLIDNHKSTGIIIISSFLKILVKEFCFWISTSKDRTFEQGFIIFKQNFIILAIDISFGSLIFLWDTSNRISKIHQKNNEQSSLHVIALYVYIAAKLIYTYKLELLLASLVSGIAFTILNSRLDNEYNVIKIGNNEKDNKKEIQNKYKENKHLNTACITMETISLSFVFAA